MTAISQLPTVGSLNTGDWLVLVDVTDTSESANGTTKKVSALTLKQFYDSLKMTPVSFNPSAPTATASTTLVHAGFGGAGTPVVITPLSSGVVKAEGVGQMFTNTAVQQTGVAARYGQIAGAATTVASGSNGGTIANIASWSNPSAGVLDVASTTGYATSGTIWVANSGTSAAQISYTGKATGQFTGCTFVAGVSTGTVSTGGAVTGYPPQGSPVAGTAWGNNGTFVLPPAGATNQGIPFALTDILALTPNQAYWFDLVYETGNASDTAQPKNIRLTFGETS